MQTQGKVFKYPDNVDTDVIIPARYLNTPNAQELALHCMEDIDTEFVKKVKAGDVMVAGWNFGCGSSREHAPLVIKTCGTGCVIAKSFARIFYRNAINIGLPILECEEAAEEIDDNVQRLLAQAMADATAENLRTKQAEQPQEDLADTAEFPPVSGADFREEDAREDGEDEEERPVRSSRIDFGELQFGRDYEIK